MGSEVGDSGIIYGVYANANVDEDEVMMDCACSERGMKSLLRKGRMSLSTAGEKGWENVSYCQTNKHLKSRGTELTSCEFTHNHSCC
jgi:hypothetical protein